MINKHKQQKKSSKVNGKNEQKNKTWGSSLNAQKDADEQKKLCSHVEDCFRSSVTALRCGQPTDAANEKKRRSYRNFYDLC